MPVNIKTRLTLLFCAFLYSPIWGLAQPSLDPFNVVWTEPGPGPAESMPLGNGDIGLNLWVEPGGDQVEAGMDGWMRIVDGKVEGLVVTPASRVSDVKINQLTYE
jgi:hypothetical protein